MKRLFQRVSRYLVTAGGDLKIRLGRGFWTSKLGLTILGTALGIFVIGASICTYYYISFGRMIDARLSGQIFQNTSRVYGAPQKIFTGEKMKPNELASYLLRADYSESEVDGSPGQFHTGKDFVEIRPSSDSYFNGGNGLRVEFNGKSITRITALADSASLTQAEIEPELLTNLFDTTREKRRLERFDDLPKDLVDAVLSAEDKRFFEHGGFDFIRILGAAWADVRRGQKAQGASTIDMQLSRSFFFTTKRDWKRKIKETVVAIELDQRFSKQQIFELYANEVYIGNRGSFAIRGFGEAAQAYFGKDVRELTLSECAFLAGIIRAPEPLLRSRNSPGSCERGARPRSRRNARQRLRHGRAGGRSEETEAAFRWRRGEFERRPVFCGHGEGALARADFGSRSLERKLQNLFHARS